LVLNRLWQAVNVIEVPRAFRLLLQDHAQVIYNSTENLEVLSVDDWLARSLQDVPHESGSYVTTIKMRIRIPKVLLLRTYDKLPAQEVRFSRQTLFERDQYRCQYCGEHFDAFRLEYGSRDPSRHGGAHHLGKHRHLLFEM
jgi:5-methylcytosine-specific restriction endonuclease McrA